MSTTTQTLKTYWQHAWHYPRYVIGLLIMLPVGNLSFRLVPPLIAAHILQRLARGDYVKHDVIGSFGLDMLTYGLLTVFGGTIAYRVIIYMVWKLETFVVRDLQRTMFRHYMNLSASFHADSFGGSLVSRTTKFYNSYVRLADTFIFQLYPTLITFVFVGITLYSRAPLFVWLLLAFSILFVAFTVVLSRRVRELSAVEADAQNNTTGYLADSITNIMAIKSFASAKPENQRFGKATENTRRKSIDVMWASTKRDLFASSITTSLQTMAIIVSVIAVVTYGANVATAFLILTYSVLISDQLWQFSAQTLRNINRSLGDSREAILTLSEPLSVSNPLKPEPPRIKSGEIVFRNVMFDHEPNEASKQDVLFSNFNLSIKAGEKVGLVGHSGGGKTTLTRLLLRFMDVDGGEILVDGQNIAHLTQDALRSSITYVPQEPLLFHRSLSENISYGKKDASEAEIIKASKMAHAHEFVKDLPNGYDTLVGERGIKLSGGQRQRVAIARAMLKDAPILLLDEATSALDSESEVLIQDALWKLMESKTAVVIAHRLSTIQKMDRIIVLENGNIVEQGTHKKLLEQKGTYAKLWAHQSGGFIED